MQSLPVEPAVLGDEGRISLAISSGGSFLRIMALEAELQIEEQMLAEAVLRKRAVSTRGQPEQGNA